MFGKYLENVRNLKPLVHNITNYVTVNDVANVILACGGSPIMADEPLEAGDITRICDGLNINIGTLNENTIKSMFIAGKTANESKKPVLLDPVGAGASNLRTETSLKLINELELTVIKGNASEIKALAKSLGLTVNSESGNTKGVDVSLSDVVTDENIDAEVEFVKAVARKLNVVVALTGAIDLVTDGEKCYCIRNGLAMMEKITGTGCQIAGMMTAFVCGNPGNVLEAAAASVVMMGLAGEIAKERLLEGEGNSAYRNRIIDAIYNMTPEMLDAGAKVEIR